MSEEEMNDNLLMLKYFLKEEGDENWEDYCNAINKALNLISNLQKENKEIRQWKYVIDTYEDLDKLKELDEIFIKGKKYIAEENLQKELDLKDKVINKAIGHIEACKTSMGNYILSPNETEYLLEILKGETENDTKNK